MHGKFIKLIWFLSNLQWKISEWGELNKYVCISQTKVFCDFSVMFIQQTSPVSFLHCQWLRCIQSVTFTFKWKVIFHQCAVFQISLTDDRLLWTYFYVYFLFLCLCDTLFWHWWLLLTYVFGVLAFFFLFNP